MKKKILSILLAAIMLLTLLPVAAIADDHGITVKKMNAGQEVAADGQDYSWTGNQLTITADDLIVSGITTTEFISIGTNVSKLTLENLDIQLPSTLMSSCITAITRSTEKSLELVIVGNNKLEKLESKNGIAGSTIKTLEKTPLKISGSGSLDVSGNTYGIYVGAGLTLSATGKLTFSGSQNGIYLNNSNSVLTIASEIGTVIARAPVSAKGYGAVCVEKSTDPISYDSNLVSVTCAESYSATEENITAEWKVADKFVKLNTTNVVAGAVLITGKASDTDTVNNLDYDTLAKVGLVAAGVVTTVVITKIIVDRLHALKTANDAAAEAINAEEMPMVAFGDSNDAVKTLQTKLNALGYNCGEADGIFGQNTLNAVMAFQTAKGLIADGIVGKLTWDELL